MTLRNHGKKHIPAGDPELKNAVDEVQLKLAWLESRAKGGHFRKGTGVLGKMSETIEEITRFRREWENWNG